MKAEEKKLLDWQEKIEGLKTKVTELKTKTQMFENQLKELGIKEPSKTQATIDLMNAELTTIEAKIADAIQEIEDEFDLDEEG